MLCLKKPYFKCYKTVKKLTVLLRDIGTLLLVGCSSTLFKIRKCLYLFADFLEHYTGVYRLVHLEFVGKIREIVYKNRGKPHKSAATK